MKKKSENKMMHTHSHLFNGFFHFLLKNGVNFVFINYLVLVLEMFLLLVSSAVVEARIRIGWNKFRQLLPLLISRDISLIRTGRLYSSCVQSSMLHRSENWPVRKENEVFLSLLIFPCPIKSRSSLLALAHPGGLGKRAV